MELSRYCIPWTPFRRRVEESVVMLVSTAGVYRPPQDPFETEGDLSFRRIDGAATAADLRVADSHYDHACIDADLNCVFPIDRLKELAAAGRIRAAAEAHFSTGYTQNLRAFREDTVPRLALDAAALRPDAVLLTGG